MRNCSKFTSASKVFCDYSCSKKYANQLFDLANISPVPLLRGKVLKSTFSSKQLSNSTFALYIWQNFAVEKKGQKKISSCNMREEVKLKRMGQFYDSQCYKILAQLKLFCTAVCSRRDDHHSTLTADVIPPISLPKLFELFANDATTKRAQTMKLGFSQEFQFQLSFAPRISCIEKHSRFSQLESFCVHFRSSLKYFLI